MHKSKKKIFCVLKFSHLFGLIPNFYQPSTFLSTVLRLKKKICETVLIYVQKCVYCTSLAWNQFKGPGDTLKQDCPIVVQPSGQHPRAWATREKFTTTKCLIILVTWFVPFDLHCLWLQLVAASS